MKILMVIPALGPVYGGPSKSVMELSEALGQIGSEIDLVTTNANGKTSLDIALMTWIENKNYRLQYFPYHHSLGSLFSWPLTLWLHQNIPHYDLVHINTLFCYFSLATAWICQLYNIPYIYTPHGMLEPWALQYKRWKKLPFFYLLEKPALQKANAIQALTSAELQQIQFLNIKTQSIVIPNGIHRHHFEPLITPEIFYQQFPHTLNKTLIIFLGRIDPKKGLDLLALAFAQVHQKISNTHLIVAGPDNINFLNTAEIFFVEAGCRDAVTFTGILTGKLKYAALAAARVYVAPSYSEGFSLSVLEGMASGLPSIITTGCNFPEAEENDAAVVIAIDVQSLTEAILSLLEHPEQAKQMGEKARQFIFENYTWDRLAFKINQVYKNIATFSQNLT